MDKTVETSHYLRITDYYTIQHKNGSGEFVDSNYGNIASKACGCGGYKYLGKGRSGFTNVKKAAKALVEVRMDPDNKEEVFRLIHRKISIEEEVVNA